MKGYLMQSLPKCIVCGQNNPRGLFTNKDRMFRLPGEFGVVKCLGCGLLSLFPQPTPQVLSRHYPTQNYYAYKKSTKGFFTIIREYLIAHLYTRTIGSVVASFLLGPVPAIPPASMKPGKILDVGCGTGDTLISLQKIGWDVYGLDRDRRALQIVRKNGVANVRFGTYLSLKAYPDAYFDVIRLYHVIEHLDDPVLCLKLIRKKLKPTGIVLLGTPNAESVASRLFGRYWYNLDTPRHLYLFSPRHLATLCTHTGFAVSSVTFCSAGGIIGSIQYLLEEVRGRSINLIHSVGFVLCTYPLERVLDFFGMGDVFVLAAKPTKR